MKSKGTKKFVDGKTMSSILCVNYFSLMLWAERGLVPSIKVGRCRRFDPEEVICWLRDGRMEEAILANRETTGKDEINKCK